MEGRVISILLSFLMAFTAAGEPVSSADVITDIYVGEDVLVWNLGVDPYTWDPTLNSAIDGGHVINNIFECLVRTDVNGKIIPGQAERWDISDDGLKYTFHLRQGLKWSDGQPLTARDFEYAWKRAADPKVASEYAMMVTNYIEGAKEFFLSSDSQRQAAWDSMGVKAVDDLTLEVKLINPTPYFLSLVSFYTFAPVRQDVVEAVGIGWEKNPVTCISNGPFKLENYTEGVYLSLVKNENYHDAENVKLNGVIALMLYDKFDAMEMYRAGDLQVFDNIGADLVKHYDLKNTDDNFKIMPRTGTYYISFNVDDSLMSDVRIRKALSLGIDRSEFVEYMVGGMAMPATGMIPPSLMTSEGKSFRTLNDDGIPVSEYGINPEYAVVEEAKKLLEEAGYPDGKGLPEITYLYNTNDNNRIVAESLKNMWKVNLGIDVKLKDVDWAEFQELRSSGNFMISRGGWIGDYEDPMTMLELFTTSSGNNDPQWRYKNNVLSPHDNKLNPEQKEFEDLLEASRNVSGAERDKILRQAEDVLMENMVVAPIYYYMLPTIIDHSRVAGVEFLPSNKWYFGNAHMIKQ